MIPTPRLPTRRVLTSRSSTPLPIPVEASVAKTVKATDESKPEKEEDKVEEAKALLVTGQVPVAPAEEVPMDMDEKKTPSPLIGTLTVTSPIEVEKEMKRKAPDLSFLDDDPFSDSELDEFLKEELTHTMPTVPPVHPFVAAGANFTERVDDETIDQRLRARV